MKPHLLKVPYTPEYSFGIRHDVVPYFYNHWHYHPEIELIYILKGTGTWFVGDRMGRFKPNDMIMLGSNLAHIWRNDEAYFDKSSGLRSEAIVIHFLPDFLGAPFLSLSENKSLPALMEKARQGIAISGETRDRVHDLMQNIFTLKGADRIIHLLMILNLLAASRDTTQISSKGFHTNYTPSETDKLDSIYQYIMNHFKEKITLGEIAAKANISPKSFCRYFKSRTKKTFSGFLMELRIGHSCKLLSEGEMSVSDICYESGFNNISNFNRYFKMLTDTTPLQYRKAQQK